MTRGWSLSSESLLAPGHRSSKGQLLRERSLHIIEILTTQNLRRSGDSHHFPGSIQVNLWSSGTPGMPATLEPSPDSPLPIASSLFDELRSRL